MKYFALILFFTIFGVIGAQNQLQDSLGKRKLPGSFRNFAMPTIYDFGTINNIEFNSNSDENSIAGGINIYSYHKKAKCDECATGNQFFIRGKMVFPDNKIKKGMIADEWNLEIGYRYIGKSYASYFDEDTLSQYPLKDECNCCIEKYIDNKKHLRDFELRYDYSKASQRWFDYSLIRERHLFSELEASKIVDKSFSNYILSATGSYYKKYNHRIFNVRTGYRFQQTVSYLAFRLNGKIGQFDNISELSNVYSINGLTPQTNQGHTLYSSPPQVLESSPEQEIGFNINCLGSIGLNNWLSFAGTLNIRQGFNSSNINSSTLRTDILFRIPETSPCEGNLANKISFGFNITFQEGRIPVYGIGANIPFED